MEKTELLQYKCPCCGGAIAFDANLQKLKCPYCDTEFEAEALRSYDEELQSDTGDEMNWDTKAGGDWNGEDADLCSYVCNSCGGEIVGDRNTAATSCPFCGNPVVMMGNLSGALKPDFVIPFRLNKEKAKEGLRNHLKGKRLLPKVFKDENHIDEIKGIYVPFWLFDADADAHIRYRATTVQTWSDNDYIYTRTNHYSVVRGGNLVFQRVPVDGSSKMEDDLMESLEPFRFEDALDFQTAYLAGFLADKYDVTAEQSVDRANGRIRTSTEQAFRGTVHGYATVVPEQTNIKLNHGEAKYALFPVWILNTTWKGKQYRFAMNGQTGKFVGNLPMDGKAFAKWLLGLGFGIAAGVFALLALLMLL